MERPPHPLPLAATPLPLAGLRVLDFTHMIAGAITTLFLGYYGAEIVKIEGRSRPDGFRRRQGGNETNSRPFADFNRNKLGVAIEMGRPGAVDLVKRLVAASDVVVENFSVGVMERWGLDYEALRAVQPRIIFARLPGLGTTGSQAHYSTWGPNLMSLTGMTALWNLPDAVEPVGSQSAHPDYFGGVTGAFAIMTALMHLRRTGEGQMIDLAQAEVAAGLLGVSFLDYLINGRVPQPVGNGHPYLAPHGVYPCQGDDVWLALSVANDREWAGLCRALGAPAWTAEPAYQTMLGRVEQAAALDAHLAAWTRERDGFAAQDLLQAHGVPASVVMKGEHLAHSPHLRAREFVVELENPELPPLLFPGIPAKLSRTPGAIRRRAPLIGEDTDYALRQILRLDDAEIARLTAAGVLG